jgi:hypothetical protein
MNEIDHIIHVVPFDHLLVLVAGLDALDAWSPSGGVR